jgi:heme exporter protein A
MPGNTCFEPIFVTFALSITGRLSYLPPPMVAEIRDISKRYGRLWALARLSAEIPSGKAVLLTGENGAGKTTLLRVLSTAIKPTLGSLNLFGKDAWQNLAGVRSRLGIITHQNHLYDALTAGENLALVGRLTGHLDVELNKRLLERVSLTEHAGRAVGTYSAGMKRRLCFARLLLRDPEFVLLDEPFGQLDPKGVGLVEEIVEELKEAGKTIVMSTHDIERGQRHCDLHLKITGGRQIETVGAL